MKNNKGFTLIEVLIASSILFIIIMTVVPIKSLLTSERRLLSDRYDYTARLHEELQFYLWEEDKQLPISYEQKLKQKTILFQFTKVSSELIKGCVEWKNVRDKNEKTCLYGYPQK